MRAAVVGHPVEHSLSPLLHASAYAELGLTGWSYGWREAWPETIGGLLGSLDDSWAGLSVTVPVKQAVLGLLEEVSELAAVVGAVNTVLPLQGAGAGRAWRGENTDVHGIVAALGEGGASAPGTAAVLGGGATAASALAALRALGVSGPDVHVRSPERCAALLAAARRLGVTPRLHAWDARLADALGAVDVVVSTVPGGAADGVAAAVAAGGPVRGVLLDVVYSPWPTPLARAWAARGGTAVPGFSMLLHQAGEQVRLMTGRAAPLEAMRSAGVAELARRTA